MANFTLLVNEQSRKVDVQPGMPLLWVLRDTLGLTGTKFGCGEGYCGCCTVIIEGDAMKSCGLPVESVVGKHITTIEALSADRSHPVQKAWVEEDVPQCGYCQSGQVMTAAALVNKNSKPSDADIDAAMSAVLCRCGTYQRIRNAIHRASEMKGGAQ
ncbi:MAG TPA: (2Fe-2S)-binding protein [Bacteroidota bacterium]|nr:(2Fe-2S)-binding protein [Bacteroidota bacterium]